MLFLTHNTFMGLFTTFLFLSLGWVIYTAYRRHRQYSFFVYYLGENSARCILYSGRMRYLYDYLSGIQISSNNELIFDLAISTYVRRISDEDLFETTRQLLYAFDPYFFSRNPPSVKLSEDEYRAFCYNEAKLSSRSDILRYLLWLMVVNPKAITQLKTL